MFVNSKWMKDIVRVLGDEANPPAPREIRRLDKKFFNQTLWALAEQKKNLDASSREWLGFMGFVMSHEKEHFGQLAQDMWVLWETKQKTNGYFVEFGGANGKFLSNSYLLEHGFGWRGIVAEPNIGFHEELRANRSCDISPLCVAARTGERVRFHCTRQGELSRMAGIESGDRHDRSEYTEIEVETISLDDLLDRHNAPDVIDYLSIDTEGSEFDILSHRDWTRRRIQLITVEHNGTDWGPKIFDLLSSVGYERKFSEFTRFDHWYVLRDDA